MQPGHIHSVVFRADDPLTQRLYELFCRHAELANQKVEHELQRALIRYLEGSMYLMDPDLRFLQSLHRRLAADEQ